MKTLTLAASISIGGDTELSLSKAQLATRMHLVEVVKKSKDGALVRPKPGVVLQFKAGETVTLDEGALPKAVVADLRAGEDAAAAEEAPDALQAARDEGHAVGRASVQGELQAARDDGISAGRTAMLDEFDLYHDALNELADAEEALHASKAALAAETEEGKKKPLEEAVARAQKAADDAAAQADQLKPRA